MRIHTSASLLACILAGSVATAQQVFWAAPVSGNFNDPSKWVGNAVPGIANDATLNVFGPSSYTVTHQTGLREVNRLIVNGDASTSFVIRNGATLAINDPINSIFNTGFVVIGEPNAPGITQAKLTLRGQNARINGSGTILLQGIPDSSRARLENGPVGPNPSSFNIGANVLVRGAGTVDFGELGVNLGSVRADVPGASIIVFGSPIENAGGLFRAANASVLDVRSTIQNTSGGRLSTDENSIIIIDTSDDIIGGEIDAAAGGEIQYKGLNELEDVWLKGRHVVGTGAPIITLRSNMGALRIDGLFEMNLSDAGSPRYANLTCAGPAAPFDIAGTGTIRFNVPNALLPAANSVLTLSDPASTQFIRMPGLSLEGNVNLPSSVRLGRTLSPGLAAPERLGTILFARVLRLNDNSEVLLDIQGATPALRDKLEGSSSNAALIIDNNVTMRLRIGSGYQPVNGDVQTLINLAGSTVSPAISGTFARLEVDNAPSGTTAELLYTSSAVRVRWTVNACDSIDFNADSLFPDDQDLIDFLAVLAGGPCSPGNTCNDIDFNNDGLFPDDNDLIAFLRILAGGNC